MIRMNRRIKSLPVVMSATAKDAARRPKAIMECILKSVVRLM